ncbi:MAG: NADH-quinone oxidoreductase subunit C [candidate division WOR-3 bacterium]
MVGCKMEQSVKIKNQQKISLESIPILQKEEFLDFAEKGVNSSLRVCFMFGMDKEKLVRIFLGLADDINSIIYLTSTYFKKGESYPSLTLKHPSFNYFEREIFEEFGIEPSGHPFLKGIRFPLGQKQMNQYKFYDVNSNEIHQVAVGPVHAGVIEPGHFRFLCDGEKILHLEIQLGYQHRGIEDLFIQKDIKDKIQLAESIAGDTVIGHGYAYIQLLESLFDVETKRKTLIERAIMLELERIAVHIGDIGAIANDVAYMLGNSVCGANRTYVINTSLSICGSRFGRGFLNIGKNNYSIDSEKRELIKKNLSKVRKNVEQLCEEMFDLSSVVSRFEGTGIVTEDDVKKCGFVGMVARSSGVKLDVRENHPFGAYKMYPIYSLFMKNGDVFSRAYLRYLEIQQSINFIDEVLDILDKDENHSDTKFNFKEEKNVFVVSMIEGWRGEIVHILVVDENGNKRYKVKDPSFTNWFALALAVRGFGISDFPLCNKSFNLSYSGNDL